MERVCVILVAEDDVVIRNLIRTVLTREGYLVLVARDGIEAMEISEGYAGTIDLLLSDITMPRLGGLGLLERLRCVRPSVKALLISGRTSSEIGGGPQSFDFLPKPFLPAQLKARVEIILSADAAEPDADPCNARPSR